MRLRTLWGVAGCALLVSGIMTAGALIRFAADMREAIEELNTSSESVYLAEQLELALERYNGDRLLSASTDEPQFARQHHQDRENIAELVQRFAKSTEPLARGSQAATLAESIDQHLAAYLEWLQVLEKGQLPPVEVYQRARALLGTIDNLLAQFVNVTRIDMAKIAETANVEDEIGDYVGLMAILSFVVIVVAAGFVGWRLLYRPLILLSVAVSQFARGEPRELARECGAQELRDFARTFNHMVERLRRSRDLQLQSIAAVAHDLKNPLLAISMVTQLLGADDASATEKSQLLASIQRQAFLLERMVGDLLDSTRIEAGQLELRLSRLDLGALLAETVALYKVVSPRHQIRLELPDKAMWCQGDPLRLSQVLGNLVGNAIKYSPQGGLICITAQHVGRRYRIAVSDEGIGIATSELHDIFEPFRRSPRTKDIIPGVGLGLSVSKRIAEAHDGQITVSSEEGRGSTFSLFIPADAEEAMA